MQLNILILLVFSGALFLNSIASDAWAGTSAKPKAAQRVVAPPTVAVVGGKNITQDQLKAEMARRPDSYNAEKVEQLLDSIIRSELLFAAAKNAGYENSPEVIQTVKQAMVGKYLRENLEPKLVGIKATDDEIAEYYKSHQAEFSIHGSVRAALIKISLPKRATEEKRIELLKLAQTVHSEAVALDAGVPAFGGVAVKYSEDQDSRYRGGDIGWLQVGVVDGRRDKKVSEAIFALKTVGEVSPVITADDGYYIVKMIESRSPSVKPFAQVKDGVRYHVIQDKKKIIENELIEKLKGIMPVTINRELLKGSLLAVDEQHKELPPQLPNR